MAKFGVKHLLVFLSQLWLASADNNGTIVVVGAGVSGLTAAAALRDHGKTVIVVEGRAVAGGRIHWLNGQLEGLDVGGHWVQGGLTPHDNAPNPVARYLHQQGIGMSAISVDQGIGWQVFDEQGELPSKAVAEVVKTFEAWSDAAASACASAATDLSLESVYQRARAAMNSSDLSARQEQFLHSWQAAVIGTDEGAPLGNLSCQQKFLDETYYTFPGNATVVNGGYKKLVEDLSHGLDIRYSSPVEGITARSAASVDVHLYGGQTITDAAAVIVTAGLGSTRRRPIAFAPPLPVHRKAAAERIGFGALTIVALRFDDVFWSDASYHWIVTHPAATWCKTTFGWPCLGGIMNPRHQGSAQRALYIRLNPGLIPHSDAHVAELAMEVVRAVFPEAPAPAESRVVRWENEEWIWGSTSFQPVNATGRDHGVLAEPVGPVRFAGEATCEAMYATVHGAFVSGLREAKRLLGDIAIVPKWASFLDDTTSGLCSHPPVE